MPPGVELYVDSERSVGVSSDGRRVAFIGVVGGVRQLYMREIDRFEAVPVRNTESASECCAFSPDGRSLVFASANGTLRRLSLSDGLVATIAFQYGYLGAAFDDDNSVVFVRSGALWRLSSSGGEPTVVMPASDEGAARFPARPSVLPGSGAVLFESSEAGGSDWRIEAFSPETGVRHTVLERGRLPTYMPSGHLVFYRDGDLLAAPFDAETQRVTGESVRMLESIPQGPFGVPLMGTSAAGVLAYAPMVGTADLVWVSRQGAEEALTDDPRLYGNPRLDPSGGRVLVQAGDLWTRDFDRSTFTRLTGDVDAGAFPVLTPDGSRVVYRAGGGLRWLALDGSGRGEAIPETTDNDYPGSITADGERLLFVRLSSETSGDIFEAPIGGGGEVRPVLTTAAYEGSAKLSPDNRWLAYTSNDSGRYEVYLRPFPAPDRRWQVSTGGGTQPVWNPNGRAVFYRSGDRMMLVSVALGEEPTLSEPTSLFEEPYAFGRGITIPNYDVSADGQRFLMVKDQSNAGQLNLILNWTEELRRLVPVP
jgi:serine/threonine-protein kinase